MKTNSANLSIIPAGVIKDILHYTPGQILPALCSIISVAVFTRLFSPAEYGLYVLVITAVLLAGNLTFDWIAFAVWRYFERYKIEQKLSVFLGTISTFVFLIFIITASISYIITIFLKITPKAGQVDHGYFIFLLRIGILLLGVQTGYTFVMLVLRVNRQSFKYGLYSSIKVAGSLTTAIFIFYFIARGVESILWAAIIFIGGIFMVEIFQFIKKWHLQFFPLSGEVLKKVVRFGGPHIGVLIGTWTLSLADRYLIEYFMDTRAVGIYNAGYQLASFGLQIIYGILILTAVPIIVQTYEKNGPARAAHAISSFVGIYLLFLVPAVAGIILLAKDVAYILLGESFRSSFEIVPWISGGIFFLGLSQYLTVTFQLKEKPYSLAALMLGTGFLNIMLNILLIPRWGIAGSAAATFLSYLLCVLITGLVNIKMFPVRFPWVTLVNALVSSLIMYVFLRIMTAYWLGGISPLVL
ncbi:MAG: polysaccharide biosynthesis C-terminal domain-containing protein, partial [Planctomycetota bacterium]